MRKTIRQSEFSKMTGLSKQRVSELFSNVKDDNYEKYRNWKEGAEKMVDIDDLATFLGWFPQDIRDFLKEEHENIPTFNPDRYIPLWINARFLDELLTIIAKSDLMDLIRAGKELPSS